MNARMNLVEQAPAAYQAMRGLEGFLAQSPLPESTLLLVKLRASQINGCAFCVDMHGKHAKQAGESDERLFATAVWQESPLFTGAERAALALTEDMTRFADRAERVGDEVWDEAARHYDEPTLAALIIAITTINAWNRIAVATRMVPGSAVPA
ncbi:carboxymuconolactone decarboxylase family protein [Streptomonospora litoralis]|uniref:Carboxymuconolactone decarboxylase family protein n=1 Tax=Streptomonospora litoralis TaxID=2498135 RepID=A0A4P6PYZ0_9ACTN|nr:carboxymuconolactone decarboxylase family protein [Streptomonospora litoralis]QBI53526.1 Carboxymuconolactone decarboxylase family protein [Streptomonospora litoralis]